MKNKGFLILFLLLSLISYGQRAERQSAIDNCRRYYNEGLRVNNSGKREAIKKLRSDFAARPYRYHQLGKSLTAEQCLDMIDIEGVFVDLKKKEQEYLQKSEIQRHLRETQNIVADVVSIALARLWIVGDAYRRGELSVEKSTSDKVWKSIIHYTSLESGRPNESTRFLDSCFGTPTMATNIYFCYLSEMDKAEAGGAGRLVTEACEMLKTVGLQAWTQPYRNDETDKNVVSVERFRNHVWWVGGNGLGYRALLPVAAMFSSIPMVDVVAEVCLGAISVTSQNTYYEAFWREGFTADGAGWGHGNQCLIWGYPIHGTASALGILNTLRGTPWEKKMKPENTAALMNFFRGGNWYYYKGHRLPCLDRYSAVYNPERTSIPYSGLLNNVITYWKDSFSLEEQQELLQLKQEVDRNDIRMENYCSGMYQGTRWFFNNDDLIKKTPDYHIMVNMASVRCDGLESAPSFADCYNFYTTDGLTLFQRSGDEYFRIMGGWDVTAYPGVTAREGMEKLNPAENWRGYCSKHNFAVGATDGGDYAVGGYIFEKMNASDKDGVNDRGNREIQNAILYDFKAYKGYFMFGDYFVALGAGVTNDKPELEGNIRTTIDQTNHSSDIYILEKGGRKRQLGKGANSLKGDMWVVQKGQFAYRILPEFTRKAFATSESIKARWGQMNNNNEKKKGLPKQINILHMWADHGRTPVNDTYGYVVYAGGGQPKDELPFRILRNDTLVQAACSIDGKIIESVFYPGHRGLEVGNISLTASEPCAVLIKEESENFIITVTDACMNTSLNEITLYFNGRVINVPVPQGELGGKPSTIICNK
ncbi:polysaccharide lyase family 8 super-sandwich domain-containing protein [Bacteroides sp. CG01]|uniref:polysaccharide lyase family 8 super-sandwich domain-containing protein n=2 Tax=unclassified Bacteroides TaxID=2646097 RepID=UPI002AFFEA47|nr:polysaccharide lyase family 8 super-sandwich domain-containing protein [Bacteroides sp. CG01]